LRAGGRAGQRGYGADEQMFHEAPRGVADFSRIIVPSFSQGLHGCQTTGLHCCDKAIIS
jgi:hypothetical protein